MIIDYGSPAYIISALLPVGLLLGLYFLLRGKSRKIQKNVILSMSLINLCQHVFKFIIYPQFHGSGFNLFNTAYNICAFLIIFMPVALFLEFRLLSDLVFCVGSAAGIIALLIPYWNIGDSVFSWEFFRFHFCHSFLFVTASLTLMLGIYKPRFKDFIRLGSYVFLMLAVITANNALCMLIGLHPAKSGNIYDELYLMNVAWTYGPPEQFSWVLPIAKFLSPDAWVGANDAGACIPFLWYLVPFYIIITALAMPIYALLDSAGAHKCFNFFISPKKKCEEK